MLIQLHRVIQGNINSTSIQSIFTQQKKKTKIKSGKQLKRRAGVDALVKATLKKWLKHAHSLSPLFFNSVSRRVVVMAG